VTKIIDQGRWEEIGSIDQEAATVAFGDRAVLGSDFVLRSQGRTIISTGAPKVVSRLADPGGYGRRLSGACRGVDRR
jgi:hypothetical protein